MPRSNTLLSLPPRPLLYLAAGVFLVAALSLADAVIVPLALAAMVGFVLAPPVAALERIGLPRIPSVAAVLLVVLMLIGTFGYALSRQLDDLATHMPEYAAIMKAKVATLRETRRLAIGQIETTVSQVAEELEREESKASKPGPGPAAHPSPIAQPVAVVDKIPSDLERLRLILEPVLGPIAMGGIVLILVCFVLVQREDIRNRLIRLIGPGNMTITTRALDEVAQRISRFLFVQSVINAGFGVCVTVGLLLIGVPYALVWGVTAALLRFVPYLGSLLALLMPTALALVSSQSWWPALETVALFLALDAITANIVEPVVIGTHTGVSSLALLVSAMFWTWLWGPVGLLLSAPLTVSLAAIGKHFPELQFFAIILGDEPPLEADVSLYQRLLAGDEDEASEIISQQLTEQSPPEVFDRIIVPALVRAQRDYLQDETSPAEYQFVTQTILDLVRHYAHDGAAARPASPDATGSSTVLAVPARNTPDEVGLEMLSHVLGPGWVLERLSTATLASELLRKIAERAPDVVCISALPPGGLSHARYLCKRIHAEFPSVRIWILRPGTNGETSKLTGQLTADGASVVLTSFRDAAVQIPERMSREVEVPEPLPAKEAAAGRAA